jgi:hypothetical protein
VHSITGLEGDGEGELAAASAFAARRFCMAVMGVDGGAIAEGVGGDALPGAGVRGEDMAVSVFGASGGVVNTADAGVGVVVIAGCVGGLDIVLIVCFDSKRWGLCSIKGGV